MEWTTWGATSCPVSCFLFEHMGYMSMIHVDEIWQSDAILRGICSKNPKQLLIMSTRNKHVFGDMNVTASSSMVSFPKASSKSS
jgi:hypothetical protein